MFFTRSIIVIITQGRLKKVKELGNNVENKQKRKLKPKRNLKFAFKGKKVNKLFPLEFQMSSIIIMIITIVPQEMLCNEIIRIISNISHAAKDTTHSQRY